VFNLPAGWTANSLDGSIVNNMFVAPPPIANAGPNQFVQPGSIVTLDGSASSDPLGRTLTYAWSFNSKPAGSTATLSNPTAVNPTFTVDQPGNYVVQLVVTDSAGLQSTPSTVTLSTTNTPPVASAGANQHVTQIGATIQLDGSQSFDPDGDPLTYQWSLVSIPTGSRATLSNPNIVNPTFIADEHGSYVVKLIVSDPFSLSSSSEVTISSDNLPPVANAGTSKSGIVGETVTLDGSGSHDPDGDPITYQWSFTSVPSGSTATIASPTSAVTSFVPDLPGAYVVQLIVNDGFVNSAPSSIEVQVVTVATAAIQQTQAIQSTVAAFPPTAFVNANMPNQLNNKLNAVITDIQARDYASALDQLQNDILLKIDGCAATGTPDKDDWINNCPDQNQVYPRIQQLIQLVQTLLAGRK
jgi:hypothetical protein